jgi:hypothetical protein
MVETDEYQRRQQAITWYEQGVPFTEITRRLGRSRDWLAKWLQWYRQLGWEGLRDRSRAPHASPPVSRMLLRSTEVVEGAGLESGRLGRVADVETHCVKSNLD